MNALGAAYVQRVRGDHADNVETAIPCLRSALNVRTPERGPMVFAEANRNIAHAYCLRPRRSAYRVRGHGEIVG